MDDCDLASMREDFFRRRAIDKALGRNLTLASRTECVECGEPIPEARQKAVPGCTRCIDCQEALERMNA